MTVMNHDTQNIVDQSLVMQRLGMTFFEFERKVDKFVHKRTF